MQKIVLDTSVLLMPAQRKLDIFAECERLAENRVFLITKATLDELTSMAAKRDKSGIASRIALELIEKNKVQVVDTTAKRADDAMVELAKADSRTAFASNDSHLRRRIKDCNARVICLKGESRMDWC